ncbi:glycerophosphodiester phosphodiesterase family protein [Gryllotalpicola ginsengisoli]|uniref:glycerophosphodiester phosphodiesterase family protein n=1 Tax=Gryllotalpicola ginsengisoli TaxID=444608 RepID=UPI0003B63626|nr:glycerophosphodiester phosphodiesterase family protein [Gryllotalpicola ginsengisoli]
MLAHRGLATSSPENTLLAFANALEAGAAYLETDVHASSDGVAIISHDPDLGRVAGRKAAIRLLTAVELAGVDLGAGQTYTTLEDALTAFPDARFNIDVKSRDAAEPAARAIRAAGALGRVLVTSFDDATRRATLRALGGEHRVATSASRRGVIGALLGAWLGLPFLVRRALDDVDAVQVPERMGRIRVVGPRFLDAVHRAGVEVHVWTVNDEATMRRLLSHGVDGIVTDRADVAVAVVRELAAG